LSQDLPEIVAPRQFKATERRQLQEVIEKSFALDPDWNAALHMIDAQVKAQSPLRSIPNLPPGWHFNTRARIVGGTLLMNDPDASTQLVPGPLHPGGISKPRSWHLFALFRLAPFARRRDDPRLCQNPRELANCGLLYPKFGGQSSLVEPLLAAWPKFAH